MTVKMLKEALDEMDDEVEVRIATQPHWPFMSEIDNVVLAEVPEIVTREQFDAMDEESQERLMDRVDKDEVLLLDLGEERPVPVCYIGEGRQLGYLPGDARNALEWNNRL